MTQNEGTPIAVAFSPDNRQFAAGTLAARQGQLGCKVYFMSTSSNSEGPAYTASQGSMLLSLDWQSESRVVAVFDTYIAVLDPARPPRPPAMISAVLRCKVLRPASARPPCC